MKLALVNRCSYASEGEDMFGFDMPRWRFDLLHPVDIVEDIAIGHGYEDLERRAKGSDECDPTP